MKPPPWVQIGPKRYVVSVDQAAIDAKSVAKGDDLTGHLNVQEQTIYLAPGVEHDSTAETLLHEVLHGCFMTGEPLSDDDEERSCILLGHMLLDVLRRNPRLVSFLLAES